MHLGVTEAGEGEDGRMKSAIGIGALLLDGLGDTIRVSLTEDPEFEIGPCRCGDGMSGYHGNAQMLRAETRREAPQHMALRSSRACVVPSDARLRLCSSLARMGETACRDGWGVAPFQERHRDFSQFNRRQAVLVEKKESDAFDYGAVCHRDGTVFSSVTLDKLLAKPELVYAQLGCKMSVGMPFKDIATSDSIILDRLPAADDARGAVALKRLQEVGVGVLAPLAALKANPRADAVAIVSPKEVAGPLPAGVSRVAIELTGAESEEEVKALAGVSNAVCLLINVPAGVSRLHAQRRAMDLIMEAGISLPVINR